MGPRHPPQASAVPQGWEMHILTTHSRVSESYPYGRSYRDGSHQSGQCLWLADPTSVTKVQSFDRFVNFHWQFIQEFLHVAKPLHQLTKKGEAWRWTEAEQEAFEELKWLITLTPILMQPNQDVQFQLEQMLLGTPQGKYCLNCVKTISGIW